MQRVAIARTLMQQPKLLLADEPVASLDPESSAQVMDVLFRIVVEDQLTVICTLHQVELALGWANRIIAPARRQGPCSTGRSPSSTRPR